MSRLVVTAIIALSISFIACKGDPPPPQAAAVDPAVAQAEFEEQQQKIEAERAAQAEFKAHSRSFVTVEFAGFDDEGRVTVTLGNPGELAIDDLSGGIHAETSSGDYLASTGYTEAVPGQIFLEPGASMTMPPFISPKPDLNAALEADATGVVFSFEARSLTYADGSSAEGLGGS